MTIYARWNRSIIDASGNVRNASVAVYKESDGLLATIYSDRNGATPKANPFTLSNSDYGLAFFHAAGAAYKIVATDGSWSQTWRYEPVGLGAEYDVASFIAAGQAAVTVNSIAALKALPTATYKIATLNLGSQSGVFVFLSGNYASLVTADTVGGAYLKADDTATSSGAWVRIYASMLDIKWFGAVGDNSTDDTTAIQIAANVAALTNGAILLPKGNFKITSAISVTSAIGIYGISPTLSQICPSTNSIIAVSVNAAVGPILKDFGIAYPSAGSAGAAVQVTYSSGECGFMRATNVRTNLAYIGFYFIKASQWVLDGCVVLDSTLAAYWVENQNAVDSGDGVIVNCEAANPTTTGATSGLIWRSSSGLRVINNKFNMFRYGINIQLASGAACGDLLIHNNSIEAVTLSGVVSAITMQRLGTTGTLHSVMISGNQINGYLSDVNIPLDANGAWVTGLVANDNALYGMTTAASSGFILNSVTAFVAIGNELRSGYAGTVFFTIGSSATSGFLDGNISTGSVSADSIASTSTVIGVSTDYQGNLALAQKITSSSPTAGIGYAAGAGGTVTQGTSKSTGVTLSKVSGRITMHNAALASGAKVSFVVTNTAVAATDIITANVVSGGTAHAYRVAVTAVGSGSFTMTVENITGGSLSESPVIGFAVIKAVAA